MPVDSGGVVSHQPVDRAHTEGVLTKENNQNDDEHYGSDTDIHNYLHFVVRLRRRHKDRVDGTI